MTGVIDILDRENWPCDYVPEFRVGNLVRWRNPSLAAAYRGHLQDPLITEFSMRGLVIYLGSTPMTPQASNALQSVVVDASDTDTFGDASWRPSTVLEDFTGPCRMEFRVIDDDIGEDYGAVASWHFELLGANEAPITLSILTSIRAVLNKNATKEQMAYSVAGRSLQQRTVKELLALQGVYERRWADEQRAEQAALGIQGRRKDVTWRLPA